MRGFIDRLRGRKRREAEDALKRLDEQADKGPEAARRFEEATRRLIKVPKGAAKS